MDIWDPVRLGPERQALHCVSILGSEASGSRSNLVSQSLHISCRGVGVLRIALRVLAVLF